MAILDDLSLDADCTCISADLTVSFPRNIVILRFRLLQANGQNAGSSMMENLNQLLIKQRQQQEEVKQHEHLKQKQAQQLAAQQAGLPGTMSPLALQQMLNQKANKASHPAIEQLQKNLRQASQDPSQEGGELRQQRMQSASLQQQQMPSDSPGIPGIDAQLMLNERGELCQVGGIGNGTDALAKAQKKKVIRQQQKRLVLLRHASKCRVGPSCSIKFCPQMVVLWKHMKSCHDKSCKTAHCLSSRCVLNHYRICKGENRTETCEVCSPVMKHFRVQAAANGDEPDESMEDLAREAQTVSSVGINANAFAAMSPGNITSSDVQRVNDQQQQLSRALEHSQQQQAQMQNRRFAPTGSDTQQLAEIQAAQQKLQQQQLLLQQLQQQQAQLLDQQKQLQQQQQQVLPQTQQGQQLQQQQTLLQKLQQEFQQQQQLLQHELQRQSLILQQGRPMSVDGPSDGNKRKRATEADGGKRLSKMARELSAAAMRQKRSAGAIADGQPPMQRSRLEEGEEDGKPSQKTTEGTIDTVTSLVPSMTRASIIEHLDSLQGGLCLTPRRVGQRCLPIIRKLINDPCGWVFRDPVDPVELGLPDYFDVVKKPMHLALVEEKLGSGVYKDLDDFEKDVRLVFDNAIMYNGKESDVGEMASDVLKCFEREYNVLKKAIKAEEQMQKRKGDSCALCGSQRRLFEPTVLYCNGACGMQRIRRNAFYYTDPSKQNHWCTSCHGLLKHSEPVALDDGSEVSKSSLQKYKNDALPEEAWVQCDECTDWVHQICALFNGRRNKTAAAYTCPSCYIKKKNKAGEGAEEKKEEMQVVKCAKDLPQCSMSEAIEKGLEKALAKKYEEKAAELEVGLDEIDKVDGISVRVVSNMERQHLVRDEVSLMARSPLCVSNRCSLLPTHHIICAHHDRHLCSSYTMLPISIVPDPLHFLGVTKIHNFISMSDMKYNAIVNTGIKIVNRVEIPKELVPEDAQVEITAKVFHGYNAGKAYQGVDEEELKKCKGRDYKYEGGDGISDKDEGSVPKKSDSNVVEEHA